MSDYDLNVINSKLDLLQLVESTGGRLHKSGSEYRTHCPIHGGDNETGFAIYDNGKRWTCFTGGCGSGDALGFIMATRKIGLLQAIEIATGGKPIPPEETRRIQEEHAITVQKQLEEQINRAQAVLHELKESQIWLAYHDELTKNSDGIKWWEKRGVGSDWQNFWQLGYNPDKRIWQGSEMHVKSATIPIWDYQWACSQVKHRLIDAPANVGKYRYEYSDLPAPVYLCDPELEKPKNIIIVEGEIKAMVTFLTLDTPGWQVLGMPGKNATVDALKKHVNDSAEVYVCCDPDTGKLNEDIVRGIGVKQCRIIETPIKIDDYILEADITREKFKSMMGQSRRIR